MLNAMTDHIRKMVAVELVRRDMSQKDLAEKTNRKRQQINNVLQGRAARMPDVWEDIFNVLGWELRIFDKHGNEIK